MNLKLSLIWKKNVKMIKCYTKEYFDLVSESNR